MSDSPDLIDKTDALLSRYRGTPKASADSDFPVLTDVYCQTQAVELLPDVTVNGTTTAAENSVTSFPDSGAARADLLVQEIMHRLAPLLDEALGEPLRERIDQHLRVALSSLSNQIRIEIETLVRDSVTRAVDRVASERR